jgi:tRNA-Thr(GGU) m(6)t(6)A37 methyltransferase TsaA
MEVTQIGVIHTQFKERKGTPIQPKMGKGIGGTIEIFSQFAPGLKDLEGFSHIILLYYFHLSEGYSLEATPFLDDKLRGLFATRAPRRPSPIGMSVVRLEKVEGNILHIVDVDMIDGTPLLDLKPYVPAFDEYVDVRVGWLQDNLKNTGGKRADRRFDR